MNQVEIGKIRTEAVIGSRDNLTEIVQDTVTETQTMAPGLEVQTKNTGPN